MTNDDTLRTALTKLANLWETDPRGWFYLRDGVTRLRALLAAHPAPECDALTAPAPETDDAVDELAHAIRLTVEYVGNDVLPATPGWSWFDALDRHRPDLAEEFVRKPVRPVRSPAPVSDTRREDDELVEAVARALSRSEHPGVQAYIDARAVLAALPAPPVVDEAEVRERIAQDIEAQAYDADGARTAISTGECTVEGVDTWDEAMYLAARIARGATR